jgi:hypothetical protein
MAKILTALFVSLLLVIALNGQSVRTGTVSGAIFDTQDAVILGTEVTVARQGFQKSIFPDPQTGQFAFTLAPGMYTITTKQNWWFSIRRAMFEVKENETTILNLTPTLRVLSVALEVTSKGSRDVADYSDIPKYEDFLPFADSPLNVVIEYRTKKTKGKISEYRNAKLTYNNLSINAARLKFDKKSLTVEAIGNVTKDENGRRERNEKQKLSIKKLDR